MISKKKFPYSKDSMDDFENQLSGTQSSNTNPSSNLNSGGNTAGTSTQSNSTVQKYTKEAYFYCKLPRNIQNKLKKSLSKNKYYFVFNFETFVELLDDKFFKLIRNIQNKGVIWRKTKLKIYDTVQFDSEGFILENDLKSIYDIFEFFAEDQCFGTVKDSRVVNTRAFTINCYLKNKSKEVGINKPNRVFISGTVFSHREEYLNNPHVENLRTILKEGFIISENFGIFPVFKTNSVLRRCKKTSIEGLSRLAGSGGKPADGDFKDFEIL